MKYRITIVSHRGGGSHSWEGTAAEHIWSAVNEALESYDVLEGYAEHRNDWYHPAFPRFNDDGEQVSGATEVTFEDAVAWFGRDVKSIQVEEIK
jgi:hypothetical protein